MYQFCLYDIVKECYMTMKPIFNQQTNALEEVSVFDEELVQLTDQVLEFAKGFENPPLVGVAANQLEHNGERISKKFCCVNVNPLTDPTLRGHIDKWIVAVNPKISNKSGKVEEKSEGCLTWPMKTIWAERNDSIEVEYHDVEGNLQTRNASDFEASIWQHEINHLDGVWEVVVNSKNGKLFGPSIGNNPIKKEKKIGRNDPCLCGSGLKYKKCKCSKG
jgi:peptide deformylase